MNECEWTRMVCKELVELGAKVRAIVAGMRQEPGWPDRWITHKLWHGHLEFKGDSTRLTTLQRIVLRDINARQPGTAFVIRRNNDLGGQIQDHDGTVLYEFSSTRQLLTGLHYLRMHYVNNAIERRDNYDASRVAERSL